MPSKTKSATKTITKRKITTSDKALKDKGKYVDLYDINAKLIGKQKLPDKFFMAKENPQLIAQAIRVYISNQAKGTASTKGRGEVSGSSRKLYRQKGTGRARQGSIRAPHRVGGGIVFGPKPHKTLLKLPKKIKKAALASILSTKLNQGQILAIDNFAKLEPKTKKLNQLLINLKLSGKKLLILNGKSENVKLAARNLSDCNYQRVEDLNSYQVAIANSIIFDKEAIEKLKD